MSKENVRLYDPALWLAVLIACLLADNVYSCLQNSDESDCQAVSSAAVNPCLLSKLYPKLPNPAPYVRTSVLSRTPWFSTKNPEINPVSTEIARLLDPVLHPAVSVALRLASFPAVILQLT